MAKRIYSKIDECMLELSTSTITMLLMGTNVSISQLEDYILDIEKITSETTTTIEDHGIGGYRLQYGTKSRPWIRKFLYNPKTKHKVYCDNINF